MSSVSTWTRARVHLILIALVAAVLTASPAVGAAEASTSTPTVAQITEYVYQAGNKVRYDRGMTGYARDSRLDAVAAAWAKQQYLNGTMSHNPNYSTQIPKGWTRAGENVAAGYSYTQVMDAWVASPSHYANLTRDYTSVGIGYYEANGKRYWAVEFAKYPGTRVPTKPAAPDRATYPSEPAAPAGATIALASPSFERSFTGWTASGAVLEGPTTSARGGRYALVVPGSRTVAQTVNVKPAAGGTYTATIWVKPGSTTGVSGSLRLSALGGTTETATMNFSVSSGWMRVSVPLTIARAGHTALRFEVVLGSGSFRLDSASLVTSGAPAAPTAAPTPTRSYSGAPVAAKRTLPARR